MDAVSDFGMSFFTTEHFASGCEVCAIHTRCSLGFAVAQYERLYKDVAEDQRGVSSAMGWLQGLVSMERDGYIENRRRPHSATAPMMIPTV